MLLASGMVAYGTHEAEEYLEKSGYIEKNQISRPWDILQPTPRNQTTISFIGTIIPKTFIIIPCMTQVMRVSLLRVFWLQLKSKLYRSVVVVNFINFWHQSMA